MREEHNVSSERKKDHIDLAFKSRVDESQLDRRFHYEPMLSAHPDQIDLSIHFLGYNLKAPIWVSSMTGGTEMARTINQNLARACAEFGLGMGLGSCRSLLYDEVSLEDFDVRSIIGDDVPLYGNLGIAQIEQLLAESEQDRIHRLIEQLKLDGLIVHINPLQEAFQPEGDRFERAPIDTLDQLMEEVTVPIIVKEVGQGMGPDSLIELLKRPLAAVDFGASGGTNFALLEVSRSSKDHTRFLRPMVRVGHSADDMVEIVNHLVDQLGGERKCQQVIISGGVKDFLDGYYLTKKCRLQSIYGQASGFLKHAMGDYSTLRDYVRAQIDGLALANAFLKIKH